MTYASRVEKSASCKLKDVGAKMAKRRSRSKRAKNASVFWDTFSLHHLDARGVCQKGLVRPWTQRICVNFAHDWPTFGRSAPQVGGIHTKQPPHKKKKQTGHKHFCDQTLRRHFLHLSMPSSHAEFSLLCGGGGGVVYCIVYSPTWSAICGRVACHIVLHKKSQHTWVTHSNWTCSIKRRQIRKKKRWKNVTDLPENGGVCQFGLESGCT